MFNRLISNLVLGFFVVVLVVVYGVSKQQPVLSKVQLNKSAVDVGTPKENNNEVMKVEGDLLASEFEARIPMPNGVVVNARVADDHEERVQGLSGTDPLGDDEGMLFVFDQPDIQAIWMKDMRYDLDIVWLDESGQVVYVVSGAKAPQGIGELPVYKNTDPAKYVLELPAGKATEYGLAEGVEVAVS